MENGHGEYSDGSESSQAVDAAEVGGLAPLPFLRSPFVDRVAQHKLPTYSDTAAAAAAPAATSEAGAQDTLQPFRECQAGVCAQYDKRLRLLVVRDVGGELQNVAKVAQWLFQNGLQHQIDLILCAGIQGSPAMPMGGEQAAAVASLTRSSVPNGHVPATWNRLLSVPNGVTHVTEAQTPSARRFAAEAECSATISALENICPRVVYTSSGWDPEIVSESVWEPRRATSHSPTAPSFRSAARLTPHSFNLCGRAVRLDASLVLCDSIAHRVLEQALACERRVGQRTDNSADTRVTHDAHASAGDVRSQSNHRADDSQHGHQQSSAGQARHHAGILTNHSWGESVWLSWRRRCDAEAEIDPRKAAVPAQASWRDTGSVQHLSMDQFCIVVETRLRHMAGNAEMMPGVKLLAVYEPSAWQQTASHGGGVPCRQARTILEIVSKAVRTQPAPSAADEAPPEESNAAPGARDGMDMPKTSRGSKEASSSSLSMGADAVGQIAVDPGALSEGWFSIVELCRSAGEERGARWSVCNVRVERV
ncbi:hypothetical protein FVE85_5886 [Porphyridium purpureum]|uniref:Uncharacterized protein n=1 Tax=Porphyridium purpureum TaxID=35688 RepID=A0A5J4Z351_PORPP|nr:hypothetical protein FVE85_5886 [Porphyridium purpureum]|eukprot:POR0364..scf295_1